VHDAGRVDPGDGSRQQDPEMQRVTEREPAFGDRGRERLAETLDDQRDVAAVPNDLVDVDHTVAAQQAQQIVLVLNAPRGLDHDKLASGLLDHDGPSVCGAHRPLDRRAAAGVELSNDAVARKRVSHP
jgi:hypothetical protein